MESNSNLDIPFLRFDASTSVKQDFAYPSSIMYYIKNIQKSVNFYYKFVKTCKYFYSPKDPVPYFHARNIPRPNQKVIMRLFHRTYKLSINNFEMIKRIWLFGTFRICPDSLPLPFYSCLLKNIYLCDISILRIYTLKISFSDFKLLTTSKRLRELSFRFGGSIKHENSDDAVSLDEILKCVPEIHKFRYEFPVKCTSESIKKVVKILNPIKLQHFALFNIINSFDFDKFSTFMLKNPKTLYEFHFANEYPLNNEYIQKLQKFVDDIIAAGETENPPPQISFQGISKKDQNALNDLFQKYKNR